MSYIVIARRHSRQSNPVQSRLCLHKLARHGALRLALTAVAEPPGSKGCHE
jgi:hypothetical protein